MKKYTVKQLTKAGGKLWKKNKLKRVYFGNLPKYIRIEIEQYKTGNISSATLGGLPISNTRAQRIISTLNFGKIWYDLKTDKFETKNLDEYADEIIESIKSDINNI